jgi:hypothetical protein
MVESWTPRRQGDLGELSAMQWLVARGATVYVPLLHSPDCDLVVDLDGRLIRVQVKASTYKSEHRFHVTLSTRGGNESWSGLVKRLDPERCDYLFVHVADGRRWFIPAGAVGGGTHIVVGGPKYAAFEVDRGPPLAARERPPLHAESIVRR